MPLPSKTCTRRPPLQRLSNAACGFGFGCSCAPSSWPSLGWSFFCFGLTQCSFGFQHRPERDGAGLRRLSVLRQSGWPSSARPRPSARPCGMRFWSTSCHGQSHSSSHHRLHHSPLPRPAGRLRDETRRVSRSLPQYAPPYAFACSCTMICRLVASCWPPAMCERAASKHRQIRRSEHPG
jgi:hypothetical protein